MSYQINILFNLFMCLDFENSRFTQKIRALSEGGGLPRKFAPALCHINLAFVLPFTCFDLEKYRFTHRKSERFWLPQAYTSKCLNRPIFIFFKAFFGETTGAVAPLNGGFGCMWITQGRETRETFQHASISLARHLSSATVTRKKVPEWRAVQSNTYVCTMACDY